MRQQHVPNYTGHVRGMVNKDFMPQSYARVTATLFNRQHPIGDDTDIKTRFMSTQRKEFKLSNNRRFGKNFMLCSFQLLWVNLNEVCRGDFKKKSNWDLEYKVNF